MTRATIFHEAEEELWNAVVYYEERCPGLGFDFEQAVKAAVEEIQRAPQRWSLCEDGTRRLLLERFPYLIVYMFEHAHVWIISVAHCRQQTGYWTDRMR